MKHRFYIPIISIVLTIVLLIGIKLVFEKNTRSIFNQQMNVYTQFIDLQNNISAQFHQKVIDEIFQVLKNDDQFSILINELDKTDVHYKSQLSKISSDEMDKVLKLISQNGFSSIKIYPSAKKSIEIKALSNSTFSISKYVTNHQFNTINSVTFNSNGVITLLILPSNQHLKNDVYIELVLSFNKLKEKLSAKYNDPQIGLFITGFNRSETDILINNGSFKEANFGINCLVDFNFDLEKSFLTDNISKYEIAKNLEIASDLRISHSFSVNYKNKMSISILTFSPLLYSNHDQQLYLVIKNNEPFLMQIHKFNSRFFWFIASLIIIVVFFLTYLYVKRIDLQFQKRQIQKTVEVLNELNSTKNKFFSIIAHDLKNPFNGIMGMSTYLVDSYNDVGDIERKEIISDINVASKNAFNLLQNLLEWTRSQTGLIRMKPSVFTPSGVIDLALETVINLANKKKIIIEKQITTTQSGYADENMVTIIIRNLATNAVKFSPRNSTINIEVKDFKDKLVFMIIDQGIGLRSDEIDKLFRIDNSFHKKGTENETGSGLGLILCKEFVERCGGQLWVVSEFGVGSTFYFTLPRYLGK